MFRTSKFGLFVITIILVIIILNFPSLLPPNYYIVNAQVSYVWPGSSWSVKTPSEVGLNDNKLEEAKSYALKGGGSGLIIRNGYQVNSWGSTTQRYDLKSSTKSIGVTALGLAISDGKMQLNNKSQLYHSSFGIPPQSNFSTGWLDDITQLQLATHTAGFKKPGGYEELFFAPGTKWSYSDGGANWLAETLTLTYNRDLKELMFERVFTPLGIPSTELSWRDNAYRDISINGIKSREFGSGISASVNAMARIGYLYLRNGQWKNTQIISADFVTKVRNTPGEINGLPIQDPGNYPNATKHYGLLWWNNNDGTLTNVPKDAYWSWGLGDSLIVVIPSLDIVAVRAGSGWRSGWNANYDVAKPFIEPIAQSIIKNVTPTAIPLIKSTPTPTPANSLTLLPSDDAFVNGSYPNTNYGLNINLNTSDIPKRISYLKFDLSSLAGKTIRNAKLRFKVSDGATTKQYIRSVENTTWTEYSLTYNNRPAVSTSIIATISNTSTGQWVDIDVTSLVSSKKGLKISFAIDGGGSDRFSVISKDNTSTSKPSLVVIP